ncbi:MAG: hypothetical protein ABL949_12195 [Fimbriimonadaceae bacterium]
MEPEKRWVWLKEVVWAWRNRTWICLAKLFAIIAVFPVAVAVSLNYPESFYFGDKGLFKTVVPNAVGIACLVPARLGWKWIGFVLLISAILMAFGFVVLDALRRSFFPTLSPGKGAFWFALIAFCVGDKLRKRAEKKQLSSNPPEETVM